MYTIIKKTTDGQTIQYIKDHQGIQSQVSKDKLVDFEESKIEHAVKIIIEELIRLGIAEIKIEKQIPKFSLETSKGMVLEFELLTEVESSEVVFKPVTDVFINDWGAVKRLVNIISDGKESRLIMHQEDEILRPLEEGSFSVLKELGLDDSDLIQFETNIKQLAKEHVKMETIKEVDYAIPIGEPVFNINASKIDFILNNDTDVYLFDSSEHFSMIDTFITMNSKFVFPLNRKTQTLSVSVLSEKNTIFLDVSIFDSVLDDPWTETEEITEGTVRFCPQLYMNVREPLNYIDWTGIKTETDAISKLEEITNRIFFNSKLMSFQVMNGDLTEVERSMVTFLLEHKITLKNTKQ